MACTPLRSTLALVLTLVACGDDGMVITTPAVVTTGDETTNDPGTAATVAPTTSGTSESDGSAEGDATTSSSTSTGDDTTTSPTSDDSTGPICDPGQPNCVCDNGLCIDGYVCTGGACMPVFVCDGDVEAPGEAEALPTMLPDITDNDDDFHQVTGVLSGAMDVDWYRFHGADKLGYVAEPTLEIVSMTTGMRVCQFLECDNGGVAQTNLTCPDGTKFAISGDLRPGCCHTTGFQITDLDCNTNDESVQIYLRFDKPDEDTCVNYEFKAHF